MMGVNDARLHVVRPADVFPPGKVGGAAWSSLALATTLHRRGHAVTVIVPRRGARGVTRREMDGFAVVEVGYAAPRLPFVQNYFRFERLWPRLSAVIVEVAQAGPPPPPRCSPIWWPARGRCVGCSPRPQSPTCWRICAAAPRCWAGPMR